MLDQDNGYYKTEAEWISDAMLERVFQGMRFRMGWFGGRKEDGGKYTVDVLHEASDQLVGNSDLEMPFTQDVLRDGWPGPDLTSVSTP